MALLLTCGRIYTFYNIKWTYIVLLLIFEFGSVICAVAPTLTALIMGRAVAGLGAAGLLSGSTVLILYCVALKKRAMMLAIVLGVYGVGSVTGPFIGGVITDNYSLTWRFIFWINLPFGLLRIQKIRQLDIPGALLLIGAITLFGCLIGFGLVLIAFLLLQIRDKEGGTVPLYIFRNRTVCAACGSVLFIQMAMVLLSYYWPIYFQSVMGTDAKDSGIYLLPLIISNSIATLGAGWITSKTGHFVPLMCIGVPFFAVGNGLYQLIHVHSPASEWIGYQIVVGIGYGICIQMPLMAVQVVLDKPEVPTGCVMIIFFQCLGGALGCYRISQQVDGVDGDAIIRAGAIEFRNVIPQRLLDKVIEAFASALRNVFLVAVAAPVVAFVISLAMEWRRLPPEHESQDSVEA
ncbi:major facilitator superfamily domain-containing protein [Xylariales sp. AK1849]|nr:major facilitator superfamily domain-containing protein [Xylariales sp. AK1849]